VRWVFQRTLTATVELDVIVVRSKANAPGEAEQFDVGFFVSWSYD
jgi:hypothetical protein